MCADTLVSMVAVTASMHCNTFKKIAYNAILDSDLDLGSIMAFAAKGFVS